MKPLKKVTSYYENETAQPVTSARDAQRHSQPPTLAGLFLRLIKFDGYNVSRIQFPTDTNFDSYIARQSVLDGYNATNIYSQNVRQLHRSTVTTFDGYNVDGYNVHGYNNFDVLMVTTIGSYNFELFRLPAKQETKIHCCKHLPVLFHSSG